MSLQAAVAQARERVKAAYDNADESRPEFAVLATISGTPVAGNAQAFVAAVTVLREQALGIAGSGVPIDVVLTGTIHEAILAGVLAASRDA